MRKLVLVLALFLGVVSYTLSEGRKIQMDMVSVPGAQVQGGEANRIWNLDGAFTAPRSLNVAAFQLGRFEVTKKQYRAVMEGNELGLTLDPSFSSSDPFSKVCPGEIDEERPVEGVTWYDAVYFCNRLSVLSGYREAYVISSPYIEDGHILSADVTPVAASNGYRLPTEVEWEFAARGAKPKSNVWSYAYAGVDTVLDRSPSAERPDIDASQDSVAWYCYNCCNGGVTGEEICSEGVTGWGSHQTGMKQPNSLGLYDMSGNVWEWCWDRYAVIDEMTPIEGASFGDLRCCRGGSWYCAASCSCVSRRGGDITDRKSSYIGFRVARTVR